MAKTDSLTAQRLRELLDYDPLTGAFTWRIDIGRGKVGEEAGSYRQGRVVIGIGGLQFLRSRLAWLHVHGTLPKCIIDHKDLVIDHDWIDNLRPATNTENNQNRAAANRNSKSGLLGVAWLASRQKWRAGIGVNRRTVFIGEFDTAEEASAAYWRAKEALHPFCAHHDPALSDKGVVASER